jgi:Tfp pilus assembly protein PilE
VLIRLFPRSFFFSSPPPSQDRVDRLILLSPAGIPSYDTSPSKDQVPNSSAALNASRELSESQIETTNGKGVNPTTTTTTGGSKEIKSSSASFSSIASSSTTRTTTNAKSTSAPNAQKDHLGQKGEEKKVPPRLGRCESFVDCLPYPFFPLGVLSRC